MLDFLPSFLKGILSFLIYTINTLVLCTCVFVVALLKLVIPIPIFRRLCDRILNFIASCWISINSFSADLFNSIKWEIKGLEALKYREWYLVLSNHQSWADILVLQKIFNRKIPMLKFFLKKELMWVPFLGLAWWALDFPFMKRYSKQILKKNPHLKGQDLKRTKKACEKFKTIPVSIMNFVEGTRYTKEKHDLQGSQYKHLLKPKAGGIAFVLGAMEGCIHKILNITIVYPDGADSFWGFISGRVKHIVVNIDVIPVTQDITGDYFNDIDFRNNFCAWINNMWVEKDAEIEKILNS